MALPAWIADSLLYVGFSDEDEARLHAFHAVAAPSYAAVIDHFYDVIDRHDGARAILTGGAAQVARLKRTLHAWLAGGLGAAHDEAWFASRCRIGERHVAVGLPSHYMFTAVNLVRADLAALVDERIAPAERAPTRAAIDRWLDLELAIVQRSYQDASEQRLVQRERDAQRENLSAMRRLSAGLAHEVRNPLNAAHLQLELLQRRLRRSEADPALLDATALVDGEIRRLSTLLQEFLDFARPVQLTAADTDLVAIARQVIARADASAAARQVEVVLGGAASVRITGDPGKLHQILHNLIANAIDAAVRRVEVELHGGGDEPAVIVVHDDGGGIAEAVRPRIFEPFFSTKEGGTGMGLSITHSLVSLHGGEIQVANRVGAEFTVVLPPAPANDPSG